MMLTYSIARFVAVSLSLCAISAPLATDPPPSKPPQQNPKRDTPKQQTPGQDAPKPDVPEEPTAPQSPVQAPAQPAPIRVSDSIDPKAEAIVKRSWQVAAGVRTISMITQTQLDADRAKAAPLGFGAPTEVVLEFRRQDSASLPLMRVTPVASGGDLCLTHDGEGALMVNRASKIYRKGRSDWPSFAGFAIGALPNWLITERARTISAQRAASERDFRREITAASIVGVETIDGTECDVVRIMAYLEGYVDTLGAGQAEVVEPMRVLTDIAYARQDGFPRRIVRYEEGTGSTGRTTTEYTKVRVNPQLDPALFSATPPEGYTLAPPAPPAAAPAAPPAKQPTK